MTTPNPAAPPRPTSCEHEFWRSFHEEEVAVVDGKAEMPWGATITTSSNVVRYPVEDDELVCRHCGERKPYVPLTPPEPVDYEAEFWAESKEWVRQGSGMTKEQETGAAMAWSWIKARHLLEESEGWGDDPD